MEGGAEGEQPRQNFSSGKPPERAATNAEGADRSRLVLPGQEQQSWQDRPHAELVSAFRGLIQKEQQALGDRARFFSPTEIIRNAFSEQVQYIFSNDKADKQRGAYFGQILDAWDVITHDQYDKNEHSMVKHFAALNLDTKYNRAKSRHTPRPEIIMLEDPLQIRIIDAAAEAVGIPHQRGQTAFAIPQQLWDYEAQLANEERRRRGI
jgi:hypothetical protein